MKQLDPTFECDLFRNADASKPTHRLNIAETIIANLNGTRSPTSLRAVRRLVDLAVTTISQLEMLWSDGNPHLREVASTRITWPVLTGHHTAILKRNAEWVKGIGLGHDAQNQLLLAQLPARATPARNQTLRLLELVNHIGDSAIWNESIHEDLTRCDESFLRVLRSWLRQDFTPSIFRKVILSWPLVLKIKKLPLLGNGREIVAQWQDAALELLSLNCNDNPASIPELSVLGECRRFHPYYDKTEKLPRALKEDFVPVEQQHINISREVRVILKDEIRKICKEAA